VVLETGSPTSGKGWRGSATRAYRYRLLQATAGRPTEGAESSSLPTLTTRNNLLSPSMQKHPAHRRLYPTLTAESYGSTNNGTRDGSREYLTEGTPSLERMAKQGKIREEDLLPTLTAADAQRSIQRPGYESLALMAQQELLPTLMAQRGHHNTKGGKVTLTLDGMAKEGLLPTLTASSATRGRAMRSPKAQGGPSLQEALAQPNSLSPTLYSRDNKGPGPKHTKGGDDLARAAGGHLSPTFCEWYMGYPIGWTDMGTVPRKKKSPRRAKGSRGSVIPSSPTKPKSSAT
jgi:hypothetical protein